MLIYLSCLEKLYRYTENYFYTQNITIFPFVTIKTIRLLLNTFNNIFIVNIYPAAKHYLKAIRLMINVRYL